MRRVLRCMKTHPGQRRQSRRGRPARAHYIGDYLPPNWRLVYYEWGRSTLLIMGRNGIITNETLIPFTFLNISQVIKARILCVFIMMHHFRQIVPKLVLKHIFLCYLLIIEKVNIFFYTFNQYLQYVLIQIAYDRNGVELKPNWILAEIQKYCKKSVKNFQCPINSINNSNFNNLLTNCLAKSLINMLFVFE